MGEVYRALVSCPHAWDGVGEFDGLLAEHGIVVEIPEVHGQQLNESELLEIIGDYDGILAGDDHLTRQVIEAAPRLRVISKWGVGVDAIDLEAAEEHGVLVLNTPGMFGDELADYTIGFMLMLARGQHVVDRQVREGRWEGIRGHSLRGRTLGVVGLGSSGRALVSRAQAMSMEVIASDPNLDKRSAPRGVVLVTTDDLLSTADVISLHLPAQVGRGPVIDARAVSLMKDGVWLINTSRGSLVDEDALVDGLQSGRVGAAALDVFSEESLPTDHPLREIDSVVLGAHNGSNTFEAVERTTRAAVLNLVEGLTGQSLT